MLAGTHSGRVALVRRRQESFPAFRLACGGVGRVPGRCRFRRWLPVLLAVLSSACQWELPDDDQEEADLYEVIETLQGSWRGPCVLGDSRDGDDEVWQRVFYRFSGREVTRSEFEYADSTCGEANIAIEYRGDFHLDKETTAEDGQTVRPLDLVFGDVEVTDGDADVPRPTVREYDILWFRDDGTGFFLGNRDSAHDGATENGRPVTVDFSAEFRKR